MTRPMKAAYICYEGNFNDYLYFSQLTLIIMYTFHTPDTYAGIPPTDVPCDAADDS
jgi:hypothetical protein